MQPGSTPNPYDQPDDDVLEPVPGLMLAAHDFVVSLDDVREFARHGSIPESSIGPEYDEAVNDALYEVFDELGLEVGS